jgi:hypothetical protein
MYPIVNRLMAIFLYSPLQQAHWPSHMSSCAQNQSNQDEDGGGTSGPSAGASSGPPEHVDVMDGASHFLQQQVLLTYSEFKGFRS